VALRNAIDHFGDEPFLVVNGDVYFEIDFRALFDFHIEKNASLTMTVKVDSPDSKINAVAFDSGNIVRQLWGAPKWNGSPLSAGINAGAFVYSPDIIRRFVPPGVPYGFREDFMPALFEAGVRVAAFPYRGFWSDIGDNESYLRFVCAALRGEVPGIEGGHRVAASARIDQSAEIIPPCCIGENCVIEKGARIGPCTVTGSGATVGAGAQLKESIAVPGVKIPDNSDFTNQIIV